MSSAPASPRPRRDATVSGDAPIFVLAAPQSHSALIGAMIGCNPAACGLPELNLFVGDTLESAWLEMAAHKQSQIQGLLRTVAQLYAGEQSLAAVAMARRWVLRRMHWPTRRVFDELRARTAPLRIVEKSRAHLRDRDCLVRIAEACPDAFYVHVVRHPLNQGIALAAGGSDDVALISPLAGLAPPGDAPLYPDALWWEVEERIAGLLAGVPAERQVRVRSEDLFADPEGQLAAIAGALGLPADADSVSAMLHPETSPFASMGPVGALFGDDPQFLRDPRFRRPASEPASLDGALPWRRDGAGFAAPVAEHARALGYS